MSDVELLEFVEIDLPRCANTYGSAPCTAEVGVTGDFKCYNCPATCQDPENYVDDDPLTARFAVATENLPQDVDCIANIQSIRIRAQETKPAESLGTRESVTVSFQNHRHNDVGYDLYLDDRNFNPYNQGTHWGKFVARWPNLQGKPFRVIRGEVGQSLEDMETRHYYVESHNGPGSTGKFSITAKDALKFLDGNKAVAPRPSNGTLASSISDTDTSLTLIPAGVGNAEYPSSGFASIGDEYVSFTRSGDSVTLTGRGLDNSEQDEHDEEETFQLALVYTSENPSDIVDDLIFGTDSAGNRYTMAPTSYRDIDAWQSETNSYYGRLLNARIPKPTPVNELVSELIREVGLHMFIDTVEQKMVFRVLRERSPTVRVTDDNVISGSIDIKIEEENRVNAVFTYYGQKNPLLNKDENGNYTGIAAKFDADPQLALENLPLSIEKIRSRWLVVGQRLAAEDLNDAVIDRQGDAPITCSFALPIQYPVNLGSGITVATRHLEDSQGSTLPAQPAIVTRLERSEARYNVMARLYKFRRQVAPAEPVLLIEDSAFNVNVRERYDIEFPEPEENDTIPVVIAPGVFVGSESRTLPALDFGDPGDWPDGVTFTLENNGRIQGHGGPGALDTYQWMAEGEIGQFQYVLLSSSSARDGGPALYTRYPITLNNQGEIFGGGGGGARTIFVELDTYQGFVVERYGGSGAGYLPVPNGTVPVVGGTRTGYGSTTEAGGTPDSNLGSPGGDPGQSGGGGTGADPGSAVDGDSFVTYSNVGDIRGPQVN